MKLENNIKLIFNRPTGEVWRKYSKYWTLLMKDSHNYNKGFDTLYIETPPEKIGGALDAFNEYLIEHQLEFYMMIKKENLTKFFDGKVKDFEYLIKILDAFQEADYKQSNEKVFDYSRLDDDIIVISLKALIY